MTPSRPCGLKYPARTASTATTAGMLEHTSMMRIMILAFAAGCIVASMPFTPERSSDASSAIFGAATLALYHPWELAAVPHEARQDALEGKFGDVSR